MKLETLLTQAGEWLKGKGHEIDVVLSSRIRLARNLTNFLFSSQADSRQQKQAEEYIATRLHGIPELKNYTYLLLDALSDNDRYLLFERRLISKELASGEGRRSVFFNSRENASIMVNEEDHLRIQMIRCGLDLTGLWQKMEQMDNILESHLPFAFDSKFGYLTACPTNVGTGMRASVMLHLPALHITGQMAKIQNGLGEHQLILRGFYGEGTKAQGDFFQLSNQVTLGKSENDIIRTLTNITGQILEYERQVRKKMLIKNAKHLEKTIQNAHDSLIHVDTLSSEQAMDHLSYLRLGIYLGILSLDIHLLNKLFLLSQPAHLQKLEGQELTPTERDQRRAKFFKSLLP